MWEEGGKERGARGPRKKKWQHCRSYPRLLHGRRGQPRAAAGSQVADNLVSTSRQAQHVFALAGSHDRADLLDSGWRWWGPFREQDVTAPRRICSAIGCYSAGVGAGGPLRKSLRAET